MGQLLRMLLSVSLQFCHGRKMTLMLLYNVPCVRYLGFCFHPPHGKSDWLGRKNCCPWMCFCILIVSYSCIMFYALLSNSKDAASNSPLLQQPLVFIALSFYLLLLNATCLFQLPLPFPYLQYFYLFLNKTFL